MTTLSSESGSLPTLKNMAVAQIQIKTREKKMFLFVLQYEQWQRKTRRKKKKEIEQLIDEHIKVEITRTERAILLFNAFNLHAYTSIIRYSQLFLSF